MIHPLPIGQHLVSVRGERDDEGKTGPNACGTIRSAEFHANGQGWTYGVAFANGSFVFIDQRDEIENPALYRLI